MPPGSVRRSPQPSGPPPARCPYGWPVIPTPYFWGMACRRTASLLARIEAIVPAISKDPTVIATKGGTCAVGVSAVVRLALLEGLMVLEKRYGVWKR